MSFTIDFTASSKTKADTAIVLVSDTKKLSPSAALVDQVLGGLIKHHLSTHPTFKAKTGDVLTLALPAKAPYLRVLLLGVGDVKKLNADESEGAGGKLIHALNAHGVQRGVLINADDTVCENLSTAEIVAGLISGMRLGSYEFNHYKTAPKEKSPKLKTLSIITKDQKRIAAQVKLIEQEVKAICLTRDLVNEPPNKLYPETFAKKIKSVLAPLGVEVDILSPDQLVKQGFNLVMAVGHASEHLPRVVVMRWKGGKKTKTMTKPVALVGKGITFDSGGLNVKPYEGMMDMKMDMAGAAAVVGAMHVLAARKSKAQVVGIVALAENAISDEATRPQDIITSYSGKTVEILNTDAEGRLVLADVLSYIQKKHDPKAVVDLATLTGAIMIALGLDYAGVFTNSDELWQKLSAASAVSGEKIWRMPVDQNFRREMDSVFADIKNVGNGRFGGSSTAAAFLEEFIDKKRPWAHIDIAGTAMVRGSKPINPVPFARGYGVRLLNALIRDHYE
jgi:leucyl aminopeptidase